MSSRDDRAFVAMSDHEHKIRKSVLCENFKLSDRVQWDSFAQKETGNPDEHTNDRNRSFEQFEEYLDDVMWDE
ncbi:hypothetical protein BG004_000368 [Podila humilis]|nr:hypothetical protein BG004_000368 [Podila humilis]